MKKRILEIGGITIGLVILVAYIVTGTYGFNSKDRELYYDALDLQETVDLIGFPNLKLEDYPVAFYDGKNDYVIISDGSVTKRKPALNVLVATSASVDGHMEVFMPTYENMLFVFRQAIPGIDSWDNAQTTMHSLLLSTLWHETMHAWQLTYHNEAISSWGMVTESEGSSIDENNEVRVLYEQELILLKKAVLETDRVKLVDQIKAICSLEDRIKEKLPENLYKFSVVSELTEGTAQYCESMIFRSLCGEDSYYNYYIEGLEIYEQGMGKYYTLGRVKCLLLDKLDTLWKIDFAMDRSLTELLLEAVQNM